MRAYEPLLFLLVAVATVAQGAQLPESFPRCHRRDPDLNFCLKKAIQVAFPQLAKGIPELGFPPLDPWEAGTVEVSKPPGRSFNSLGLRLTDIVIHGLSKARVLDVTADLDKSRLSLHTKYGALWFDANYDLDAIVEGRPIISQGRANVSFGSPEAFITPKGSSLQRDAGRYLQVDVTGVKIGTLSDMVFYFDRLDEDPVRNAVLNRKINAHIQELLEGVLPQWAGQWSALLNELPKPIFDKVPLDQIFLED